MLTSLSNGLSFQFRKSPNFTPATADGAVLALLWGHGPQAHPSLRALLCSDLLPSGHSLLSALCSDPININRHPHGLRTCCLSNWPWTFLLLCSPPSFSKELSWFLSLLPHLCIHSAITSSVPHRLCSYYGCQWGLTTQSCGYSSTFFFRMTCFPLLATSFFEFFKFLTPF